MHSATKFLDGQGRVLGGALVGSKQFIMEKVFPFVRSAGPTLSAFNAWVLLKGMETLSLRVEKQSANALEIARWLETHPAVESRVLSGAGVASAIRDREEAAEGGRRDRVVRIEGRHAGAAARERVARDRFTKVCSITGNLGDTRTTITHPSTTTHGRVDAGSARSAGIQRRIDPARGRAGERRRIFAPIWSAVWRLNAG